MTPLLLTSHEWNEALDYGILDWDGFRDGVLTTETKITRSDFINRAKHATLNGRGLYWQDVTRMKEEIDRLVHDLDQVTNLAKDRLDEIDLLRAAIAKTPTLKSLVNEKSQAGKRMDMGDSLDVTPQMALEHCYRESVGEKPPDKLIVLMLWDEEDKYVFDFANAGMYSSQVICLLEVVKAYFVESLLPDKKEKDDEEEGSHE